MAHNELKKMSVADFIDRYYRPERLKAVPGRRERILAEGEDDMKEYGEVRIPGWESVTGENIVLYNPNWRPEQYICYLVHEMGNDV